MTSPSLPIFQHNQCAWKRILRTNFTKIKDLTAFLELSTDQCEQLDTHAKFILNLPFRLAQKMRKGTLNDPIFKQFVPTLLEKRETIGFVKDPVEDSGCLKGNKLLQKYHGRVLFVATGACAMHCRYCFRQNFDYVGANQSFAEELQTIASDNSINEVILSGGDPLSLDDSILARFLKHIGEIPHVKKVRFHTRFPIGIPERIDASFLSILRECPFQLWFIVHVNHPHELDKEIFQALKMVQMLGIPVLNQSVLLKGVNDDADTLEELYTTLTNHGILPYYLHQLDRVQGAAHFEVEETQGIHLIETLSNRLPGYAVPLYVKEVPGMPGKTTIHPSRK